MNYYKRHIGDWARKTAHLTFLEDAAYNRLIDIYYDRETPIPDGEAERLCRAHSAAEKRAVRAVLKEFFTLVDAGWQHGRCDEEIAKCQIQADANRSNGRKGGRPKKQTDRVSGTEPTNNPVGFISDNENNLTPRLQDSKTLRAEIPPAGAQVSDPRKALFDLGVSILGESKRGLIGKAVSQVGETKVAEVIAQMAAKPPVGDPVDYFAKATQKKERAVAC